MTKAPHGDVILYTASQIISALSVPDSDRVIHSN